MAKKPASLTSDLLARKGEAKPSDLKPVNDQGPQGADISILPGRQPNLDGIGVKGHVSTTLPSEKPEESGVSEDMTNEDDGARPSPPEPEIIYTPEDDDTGSRTKLVAGAFVGVALVGGVLLALMLNGNDRGVAPVLPQETDNAPATETASTPPVTVETAPAETAAAAPETPAEAPAAAPAEPDVAPLRTAVPEETIKAATPAAGETSDPALAAATPKAPAAPEPAVKAETPTPDLEPAAPKAVEAKLEAPAKAAQAAPALATT